MEEVSFTAITTARFRAAHLLLDGEPKIFRDDLALRFSGADSESSFLENMNAGLADLAAKVGPNIAQKALQSGRSTIIVRSRYTEDALSSALARGITHYVILGAGLDSFAWRRPDLASALQVIEIDHAATQQWKQRRLRELGINQPANLTFLPIDFERQTLVEGLRAGGYPLENPAFISWLGVTQYLTTETVFGTLKQVAALASGAEILFTFIVPQTLLSGEDQRMLPIAMASAAVRGEPWISFFEPADLTSHLKELGFSRITTFGGNDANDRYFAGRSDGLRAAGVEHVMRAQVS